MRSSTRFLASAVLVLAVLLPIAASAASYRLVGWNNLGMHCMDSDYAVFSLLPPYNTVHAQLVDPQGRLVIDAAGFTVTYQAVADPDGSINTTSIGKTNFWVHVAALFGLVTPPPTDVGLLGNAMPGSGNVPNPMVFDPSHDWWIAEGVPITPYDDAQRKNPYPLMRLVARDSQGTVLATTDVVLPVSDEMNCLTCHASGSDEAARPIGGWVNDANVERDYRLNALRLHDEKQAGDPVFAAALASAGYDPAGLYATATRGTAILCARCHSSEALGGGGVAGVMPLTRAMHGLHGQVTDPLTNLTLDASANRAACYRCHPGSETRCLRGAMGAAVAADGTLAMQCQNCHGTMSAVAEPMRTGWLDEPRCESCHSGTAVTNNGQIRYTSVFDAPGHERIAADRTFATNQDAPAPGLSLYRFSFGHGGLSCEACHGATHAEYPSLHRNDNLQSMAAQGHVGMLVECTSCHATQPATTNGGPHGMHPVGQSWVGRHGDAVERSGAAPCRACHGVDYRGTVLSRAKADRIFDTEDFGTKQMWRGFQIGCFTCHDGPDGEEANGNRPAVASDARVATLVDGPLTIALRATDPDHDPLTIRIVSQPAHGTVGLTGTTARYYPESGFVGSDPFTFAAWDGATDSNLATVTVDVGGATPIGCAATPVAGCRQPTLSRKAYLAITDKTPDARDALRWSWPKGAATAVADFGNPLVDTDYWLCVYGPTLIFSARVPAGGMCGAKPCWKADKRGYHYRATTGAPEGITSLALTAGDAGHAAIAIKGKGVGLTPPMLPMPLPARVQLQASSGACWEAVFSPSGVVLNDAVQIRARAD